MIRVTIRSSVYRGREGFLVYAYEASTHYRPRVFTETRDSADRIAAKMRAKQEITLEDFSGRVCRSPVTPEPTPERNTP